MARWKTVVANSTLGVWLLVDAVRSFWAAYHQGGLTQANSLVFGVVLAAAAVFVFKRQAPSAVMASRWRGIVIMLSMAVPFAYGLVHSVPDSLPAWLVVSEWAATLLLGWSILALGSNFSVFPHLRELVASGPYRFVRHPLYASYLLLDLTYLLGAPDPLSAVVWLVEAVLLFVRAEWEEEVLRRSPEYAEYCFRVPYRFLPGVL